MLPTKMPLFSTIFAAVLVSCIASCGEPKTSITPNAPHGPMIEKRQPAEIPASEVDATVVEVLFDAKRDCVASQNATGMFSLNCKIPSMHRPSLDLSKDKIGSKAATNYYVYAAIKNTCDESMKALLVSAEATQSAAILMYSSDVGLGQFNMIKYSPAPVEKLGPCKIELLAETTLPEPAAYEKSVDQSFNLPDSEALRVVHQQLKAALAPMASLQALVAKFNIQGQRVDEVMGAWKKLSALDHLVEEHRFNQGGLVDVFQTKVFQCRSTNDYFYDSYASIPVDQFFGKECRLKMASTSIYAAQTITRVRVVTGGEPVKFCIRAVSDYIETCAESVSNTTDNASFLEVVFRNKTDNSTTVVTQNLSRIDDSKMKGAFGDLTIIDGLTTHTSTEVIPKDLIKVGELIVMRSIYSRLFVSMPYNLPAGVSVKLAQKAFAVSAVGENLACYRFTPELQSSAEIVGQGILYGRLFIWSRADGCDTVDTDILATPTGAVTQTVSLKLEALPFPIMKRESADVSFKAVIIPAETIDLDSSGVSSDARGRVTQVELKNTGKYPWTGYPAVLVTLECRDPENTGEQSSGSVVISNLKGADDSIIKAVAFGESMTLSIADVVAAFVKARPTDSSDFYDCARDYTLVGIQIKENRFDENSLWPAVVARFKLPSVLKVAGSDIRRQN